MERLEKCVRNVPTSVQPMNVSYDLRPGTTYLTSKPCADIPGAVISM